ncbi:MAG: bacterial/archaeal transporter family-2 protein [Solirubrobacteraceae bacterium]|nr:bacterial/archaeal transporter family-2 protein [Solirubrobacteraceae bacterium]
MDRGTAVVLTAIAGGVVALQAPINAHLGRAMGTAQALFISFAIGTLALLALAALAGGGLGTLGEARHVPWYYLSGGVLGAIYVGTVTVTVSTLGAGGVTAVTIAGQLTMAVVVDQLGILGVGRHPISVGRVLGIALLAAGVYLIVRD